VPLEHDAIDAVVREQQSRRQAIQAPLDDKDRCY
jgi:hypothetical protein